MRILSLNKQLYKQLSLEQAVKVGLTLMLTIDAQPVAMMHHRISIVTSAHGPFNFSKALKSGALRVSLSTKRALSDQNYFDIW